MLSFTGHKFISNTIYECLSEKYNLPKRRFYLKGNIKPDFTLIHKMNRHYPSLSWEFVDNMVKSLMEIKVKTEEEIRKFLEDLGILHHYLCDFFCHAHNKTGYRKNLWKHFLYELRLDKYIKRNIEKAIEQFKYLEEYKSQLNEGKVTIHEFIQIVHNKYTTSEQSMELDMIFAFHICLITGDYLLKTMFSRMEENLIFG